MKLYIAGPMTGYVELNFPAFRDEAARLRALGFEIVNPAEITVDPASGWLECMRADIKHLVDCDGVALLPGWAQSRGTTVEHGLARALGLRVFTASHIVGLVGDFPILDSGVLVESAAEAA